mmetsp:Transcript_5260/g.10511  ORF Transcript_5260/g.10511 Transcript_5260/m.10511 type:complete len:408 (-) Transcript_5260:28-1251(-)
MKYMSIDNQRETRLGAGEMGSLETPRFAGARTKAATVLIVGTLMVTLGLIVGRSATPTVKVVGMKEEIDEVFEEVDIESSSSSWGGSVCGTKYSKTTLKTSASHPLISMFTDARGAKKFEGSDVILHDGTFKVICDSLWSILSILPPMTEFGVDNVMLGDPFVRDGDDEESGYEGIFAIGSELFVVRESIEMGDKGFHGIIEEITLDEARADYNVVRSCPTEIEFEGDSKGFEGSVGFRGADGETYMLGLCEGNHCKEGSKGKDRGHGRIVVMKRKLQGECSWDTERILEIPQTANFQDYSAISVSADGKVAITSQEDSLMWVGYLKGVVDADTITSVEDLQFEGPGEVLNFPRDENGCKHIFCNIEGIHWIGDDQVVAVSDKMKSNGKQPNECFDNDQSIHVFVLP